MTQGIILAAGLGRRLGSITKNVPKSLFRIKGTSLLERNISYMFEAGFNRVLVVVGYMSDEFEFLKDMYADYDLRMLYNSEFASSNTVSSLYQAKAFFDDDAYITTADIYLNGNPYLKYRGDYCYYVLRPSTTFAKPEWVALLDDNMRLYDVDQAAYEGNAYTGISHWTIEGLTALKNKLESIDWEKPSERNQYWDALMLPELKNFDLRAQLLSDNSEIYEFDDLDDVVRFTHEQGERVVY